MFHNVNSSPNVIICDLYVSKHLDIANNVLLLTQPRTSENVLLIKKVGGGGKIIHHPLECIRSEYQASAV